MHKKVGERRILSKEFLISPKTRIYLSSHINNKIDFVFDIQLHTHPKRNKYCLWFYLNIKLPFFRFYFEVRRIREIKNGQNL